MKWLQAIAALVVIGSLIALAYIAGQVSGHSVGYADAVKARTPCAYGRLTPLEYENAVSELTAAADRMETRIGQLESDLRDDARYYEYALTKARARADQCGLH